MGSNPVESTLSNLLPALCLPRPNRWTVGTRALLGVDALIADALGYSAFDNSCLVKEGTDKHQDAAWFPPFFFSPASVPNRI